jgi:hypothetical protein
VKSVRLSAHARDQARHRGATQDEIMQTIRDGSWLPAERGRFAASWEFAYNADWNGQHYRTKRVRPVFADEPDEIVVVTVYTYYY